MVTFSLNNLIILMPLAGDQQTIMGIVHKPQGKTCGKPAICFNILFTRLGKTWQNVLNNGHGVFKTWIITGKHSHISVFGHSLTHQGALAAITIAATAKERHDTLKTRLA